MVYSDKLVARNVRQILGKCYPLHPDVSKWWAVLYYDTYTIGGKFTCYPGNEDAQSHLTYYTPKHKCPEENVDATHSATSVFAISEGFIT